MSTEWDLNSERREAYELSNKNATSVLALADGQGQWSATMNSAALGLLRIQAPQPFTIGGHDGELRKIEVHSVRPVRRVGPDGNIRSDLVVEITQSFRPAQACPARASAAAAR